MKIGKQELKKFTKLYNEAVKKEEEKFVYNGQNVMVSYAKYLIEYLNDKLDGNGEDLSLSGEQYENMGEAQQGMVDDGMDIINFLKEKEEPYDKEGFGTATFLLFLPYEIKPEGDGQMSSSPGSIYFSVPSQNGMDILIDALTNFFLSDKEKYELFQIIINNINHKIKEYGRNKNNSPS